MADKRTPHIVIPEPGDPDRKRALNVLAQRRYRQKKREKAQSRLHRADLPADPSPQVASTSSKATLPNTTPFWDLSMPVIAGSHDFFEVDTTITQIDSASSVSTIASSTATHGTGDANGLVDFDISTFPIPADFTSELQRLESSQFTFPDDRAIDVPELQVMKAGLSIAGMLGCAESMWDISAHRVCDKSLISTPFLPANLKPTDIQCRIPHHPIFDLLPWPSVRTKFIIVFSQPANVRPPMARDPLALMQLIYDMDDSAEGLKVSGSDFLSVENWEVGQLFFKHWWWAFDRSVVDTSNALRAKRGSPKLMLGPT
ncbi:hypothetical protein IFR04_004339 [Cadophora malorum]|uniref:BZIP domain-containing protein n=1 Tax=Cadophora malorum TaxID=108018 RepID=A0A8H8BSC6_9HELO|nr:hypothetical protein IFR04_004339 [Cadophora malorum]